ncbi:alanine racemase [Aliibacillus thermotolerans]|uniref:Alanine racemase n=1 Tax=Aliibacillus thermotolerans TaxID=1834418 RepID=A0ABW0U8Y8_9BACI|nr:alanine racemase [Aliibacillus thermotolerans]MDA3129580.1 alanine racemase [Aliibacillus thermotolerans]
MSFKQFSYRNTWAEVNLTHIKYNVAQMRAHLPEKVEIMAMVKANAYGHGAVEVAQTALEAGATFLGVAMLDEAIELRQNNIHAPILILGRTSPQDVPIAIEENFRLTVFQKEWLKEANKYIPASKQLPVHLKVDTGMGRFGISTKEEMSEFLQELKQYPSMTLEGIYTHFATADHIETGYYKKQQRRFKERLEQAWEIAGKIPYIHCGNSAAALRFPEECFNMIRFGISMYGLPPSEEIVEELPFPLKEAFSLHSRIAQVKQLSKGEKISYGGTYTTKEKEWIATIPIGYADGWYRHHYTNNGSVLVDGVRAPIVGRICMDQMMIRLPYPVPVGTKVTLIGKQKNESISILEVANRLNTITYEIPCMISYRVPRKYIFS